MAALVPHMASAGLAAVASSGLGASSAATAAAAGSNIGLHRHLRAVPLVAAPSARSGRPAAGGDDGAVGVGMTEAATLAGIGAVAGAAAGMRRRQRRQTGAAASAPRRATASAQAPPVVEEDCPAIDIVEAPANLRQLRLDAAELSSWPPPQNDRLLRAARGEPVDRPPKWMMRQAGRYLPEYMATLRNSDFFTVCRTPALAAEVTLQPFRRYPTLDSLIIFSDILVIPVAMGMDCSMKPDIGPQFDFALKTPEDFKRLNFKPDVHEALGYVFDGIFWTRQRVENKVPVIGFSGAPWTLMGYMVEGGASRSFNNAKKWLYLYPEESRKLLAALRDIIVEYLVGQFDSGAPLLTVFDTNNGEIPPRVYEDFCVPDLKYIAAEVKRRRPAALMTVFPKDGEIGAFDDSAYDVVGVSWTASPAEARRQCPSKTLQGNLDPHVLYASADTITDTARRMVAEFGVDKYIANLGHGMLPTHPTAGPSAFIAAVDSCTHEAIAAMKGHEAPKAAVASTPLTLHLQDTTVSIPLTQAAAKDMHQSLTQFIDLYKQKTSATSDFKHTATVGDLRLEVLCNPSAYASISDVKMFLTVKSGAQFKVASEVPLSSLQGDLEAFTS